MSIVNFGSETIDKLHRYGYTVNDIAWIGNKNFYIDEEWFWTLADNSEYDSGYGRPEMPSDIIITMNDGSWFERKEYDGSEWWDHIVPPAKPQTFCHVADDSFVWRDRFNIDSWTSSLADFCEVV